LIICYERYTKIHSRGQHLGLANLACVHGVTTARNCLICSSSPPVLKDFVLCSYACSVCQGQSFALWPALDDTQLMPHSECNVLWKHWY